MAGKTIPDLDPAATLTGAELVEVVQGGNSRRTPIVDIAALGGGGGSTPFDVATFIAGAPLEDELVLRYTFARTVTFEDELAGSRANATTNATAATVFVIQKNASAVGTLTFAAAGNIGTFATTGSGTLSFVAGDTLSLVAPSIPDVTLANISVTFAGTR